jgi:predicted TIM-barrel fold metal-dependent hydrolase
MKFRHSLFLAIIALTITACNRTDPESAVESATEDISASLLLRDYRPQSIFNIPKTKVERAMFPVIDMHAHDYARDAEEVEEWIETMDRVGIEKTIVMTGVTGARFDSIVALYAVHADRFDVWCTFDYTGYDKPGFGPAAVVELERCVSMGAKGVGELGDKGKGLFYNKEAQAWGMHADDPRMDPLFEKCAELGLPVNIHVAEPLWMYETIDSTNDGLMVSLYWKVEMEEGKLDHGELITTLQNTLERHPNTTFVACHYANCTYDLSLLAEMLEAYPNLYLDISARYFYMAAIPRNAAAFFENYQDRLLYGTDMGKDARMYRLTYRILETEDEHFYGHEYGFSNYHFPIHGLGLSDEVLEKLYRTNALKIYR